MAFQDMITELRGSVPKLPISYSKTLINRAWRTIRESNLWSFNLFESAWITPNPINTGTVTVTQGLNTIQFDLVNALPALIAGSTNYSFITQRQFRAGSIAGIAGIYNIIAFNQLTGVATLDRIFADPSGTNISYTVYQCYYTPPFSDFLVWISIRNMQMFLTLGLDSTRQQIDTRDPQRSWYQFPTEAFYYETDTRGQGTINQSATLGYAMYELWGQAVTPFTYQCYGLRRGQNLVNPTDTLPFAIGEDVVLAMARMYAYEWAEANKDQMPRSAGPDFRFTYGSAQEEYKKRLINYRKNDKEQVDNWLTSRGVTWSSQALYYNTLAGFASPSSHW